MAFKFKVGANQATPPDGEVETPMEDLPQTSVAPLNAGASPKPQFTLPSWMKTGQDADQAFEQQGQKNEVFGSALEKRKSLPWEFWMKPGEEHRITFLDGVLSTDPEEQGRLLYKAFRFHSVRNVKFPNQWDSYVCLAEEPGGCPLCAAGDESTWVAVFPIIDHTPYHRADGSKIVNTIKLYIAKSITIKLLQKKAVKHGGLAYQCFDVSRTDTKMARVGDQIEYVAEAPLAALQKKFPQMNLPLGLDWYMKSVPHFTVDEIQAMGYAQQEDGAQSDTPQGTQAQAGLGPIGANIPSDSDLPF